MLPRAVAALAEALVARGDHDAAREALDDLGDWSQYATRSVQHLHYVRGSLWLATGNAAGAAADLLACGRLIAPWERDFPARLPWRSSAALALVELGQYDQALGLADAELRAARRFGAPRALGIALRCRGELDKTDFGTAVLEEAVATLEGSDARLEHARALYGLGRRISGRRPEAARELLSRALDLADRCGAEIAADLKQALIEAGARPRRTALEGLAALTASERRIAGMAATGMSNKAIAQALFVTTKTVEMHLGNTYRKLGIRSRQDLPEALAVDGAAA
jgi:ATP/maltotriose-dependent transcriptional regulator MalT